PVVGREFNQLRLASAPLDTGVLIQAIRAGRKIAESLSLGASGAVSVEAAAAHPDLTLPGYRRRLGSIHPITRVQREIEDIFLGLGYSIETGPEVETTYYNFDALNIPATHPARDDMDSLYVDNGSQKPEARSQKSEVRSQNTKDQTPDLTPDTLHLAPALLLRTHTSPVQIRALRKHGAPLHILAPGKAYRRANPCT
ncbi:MAG: hypothetical protein DMG21_04785, partial [Acidobacteria bacterium]